MKTNPIQGDALFKILPLDNQHVAPLRDVTPDAIKEAAHLTVSWPNRHREQIKLTTVMNFIVNRLGMSGGMADFQFRHAGELRKFMDKHGLNVRADLIRTDPRMAFVSLQPRQVGDALFLSRRPLPDRIFTGHDINWFELNNRYFGRNGWTKHPAYGGNFTLPFDVVMREVAAARAKNPGAGSEVFDAAVAACEFSVTAGASNMLGDQLCAYPSQDEKSFKFVPQLYQPQDVAPQDFQRHQEQIRDVVRFFRAWIWQNTAGWVQVLPYNDYLIFLKGADGRYDFLLPGFRDENFAQVSFDSPTDGEQEPRAKDDRHYQRWLYFLYDGWLEQEKHHAEMTFYADGGVARKHPGTEDNLRRHLISRGAYKPPQKRPL